MAAAISLVTYGGERGFNPYPRKREFIGKLTIGAGTYTTNGLTATNGANPPGIILTAYDGNPVVTPRSLLPDTMTAYSIAGSSNVYQYDSINLTFRIIVAGTELANGAAIPAGVTGDVIEFRGLFQKFQM